MLTVKRVNNNCTEVVLDGVTVLFSYTTAVALHAEGEGYYVTSSRWSATTTRHINAFTGGAKPVFVPQWALSGMDLIADPVLRQRFRTEAAERLAAVTTTLTTEV